MGSFSTFTEHMGTIARLIVPYSFMAILFVFNIIALPYPLNGDIKAPLFLMALYYWAIYRPMLVPAWTAFAAGILLDLLSGLPLGLNAIVFVATQWIMTDQRRYFMGQPFVMVWLGFAVLSTVAGLIQWMLFGLLNLHWTPLVSLGASTFLGVALFPLICVMLHLTHKALPAPG